MFDNDNDNGNGPPLEAELQKRADRADQSVLFFLAGANGRKRTGSLQNSCRSSYSGRSEKEEALIGGGKAGGEVADQQEADEVPTRSSPGDETPGDQSNM